MVLMRKKLLMLIQFYIYISYVNDFRVSITIKLCSLL